MELGARVSEATRVMEPGSELRVKFILDRKRILAIKVLNLGAFIVLAGIAMVAFFQFQGTNLFKGVTTPGRLFNPFLLASHVDVFSWLVLLFFFFLFSVMPLARTRDNYDLLLF